MEDTKHPAIVVQNLNYVGKETTPIKEASFSFGEGGIHGILSPFGIAASTVLSLLAGVISPDSASVCLDGQAVDFDSVDWKRNLGYVPNTPTFYGGMTVYELLDFVGEARGTSSELRLRQIEEALELVSLTSLEERLVDRLSVREKKRLSLAAALLGNPSFLLFDDPTPEFFDLIRMLGKHKTVVLGGGDFSAMQELCDDIVILSEGEVLASGSFEALEAALASNGEKKSLAEVYASVEALASESERKQSSILRGKEKGR